MKKIRQVLSNPIIFLGIIGIFGISYLVKVENTNPLAITVLDSQNKQTTLANYLNEKPIILEFWASWCSHCQNEVAILNEFTAKHPNIRVLAVKVDDDDYIQNSIFTTATYTILKAPSSANAIMSKYGNSIGTVPFIVLLNSDGTYADSITGETSLERLEKLAPKYTQTAWNFNKATPL